MFKERVFSMNVDGLDVREEHRNNGLNMWMGNVVKKGLTAETKMNEKYAMEESSADLKYVKCYK